MASNFSIKKNFALIRSGEKWVCMSRYLDPKADVVFKKIFGEHPKLLISFLNAILPLPPEHPIISLEYLSNEQSPKIPTLKKTIADVKCKDSSGRQFIVEMQIDWIDSFKQRLLFESGQAFVKQLEKGEDYRFLQPVYGVALLATSFDSSEHWYHHYQLVNVTKPALEVIEHLQLIFIELKKFPIASQAEKRLRLLWLRFLREINDKTREISADLLAIPEISQAIELAQESAYNEAELNAYEEYWNAVSTEKTLMSGKFHEGRKEGLREGLREGEEKGLREGEKKGLEKGLREGKEEIARRMKQQNCPVSLISACTGLSEDIIRTLS